jgi:hypothetical protein
MATQKQPGSDVDVDVDVKATPLPDINITDDTKKKKRKKGRKKKYSKGTRDVQELGHAFSKGAYRMGNAVAVALDAFYRQQSKSARKKRDGMMRDAMKNWGRGFRDGAREAAKAPYDVYKRVDVWRQARMGLGLARTIFNPK